MQIFKYVLVAVTSFIIGSYCQEHASKAEEQSQEKFYHRSRYGTNSQQQMLPKDEKKSKQPRRIDFSSKKNLATIGDEKKLHDKNIDETNFFSDFGLGFLSPKNLTENVDGNAFSNIFSGLMGDSFLNKLDFAIWEHGLKNRNQLMALHSLLASEDSSEYENHHFPNREKEPLSSNDIGLLKPPVREEESSVLMVDDILAEKSEEIKDSALKKWLNLTDKSPENNGTIEQLSYKILSLVSKEERQDEENDEEIFTAVLASMAAYQIRKIRRQIMHGRVKRDEERVCYRDLGCFTDEGAFDYFDYLPDPPEEIGTKYLFYSRSSPEKERYFTLDSNNKTSIAATDFDPNKQTKIIVHGFGSSCHKLWVREMRVALLTMFDLNLICVDWENGATVPNYMRAASNTRLVGRQVSQMIKYITSSTNASIDSFHLIGFSLGAHVAGHAGKSQRLKRISGLDPAGPLFENSPTSVRLDRSDAEYVDIIHTNAESLLWGGLGAYQPMGHVDFYPNGGRMQKGCDNLFVGGVTDILWPTEGDGRSLCNHRRGYKYFVESIAPVCKFPSFVCNSFEKFLTGECFPCASCGNMGFYSDQSEGRGQLYLVTRDQEPFCANQYKVTLKHSGGPPLLSAVSTYGKVEVTFIGSGGINETISLTRIQDEELKAGSTTTRILVPHPAITDVRSVQLLYTLYDGWVYSGSKRWAVDKFTLMDSFGHMRSICQLGVTLESGVPMVLKLKEGDCTPQYRPWRREILNGASHTNSSKSQSTRIELEGTNVLVNDINKHEKYKFKPENNKSGELSTNFAVIHPSSMVISFPVTSINHSKISFNTSYEENTPSPLPVSSASSNDGLTHGPTFSFSPYSNLGNSRREPAISQNTSQTSNDDNAPNRYPDDIHYIENPPDNIYTHSNTETTNIFHQEVVGISEEPFKVIEAPQMDTSFDDQTDKSNLHSSSIPEANVQGFLYEKDRTHIESGNPSTYFPYQTNDKIRNINSQQFQRPGSIQNGQHYPFNNFNSESNTKTNFDDHRYYYNSNPIEGTSDTSINLNKPDKLNQKDQLSPSKHDIDNLEIDTSTLYWSGEDIVLFPNVNSTTEESTQTDTTDEAEAFSYVLNDGKGVKGLLVLSKDLDRGNTDLNSFLDFENGFGNIKLLPYNSLIDGEIPINEMAKSLFGKTKLNDVNTTANIPKITTEKNVDSSVERQRTKDSEKFKSPSPSFNPYVFLSRDVPNRNLVHNPDLSSNLRSSIRHQGVYSANKTAPNHYPSRKPLPNSPIPLTRKVQTTESPSFISQIIPSNILTNLAEHFPFSSLVSKNDEGSIKRSDEKTDVSKVFIIDSSDLTNDLLSNRTLIEERKEASSVKPDKFVREKGLKVIAPVSEITRDEKESPSIFSWKYYFGHFEKKFEKLNNAGESILNSNRRENIEVPNKETGVKLHENRSNKRQERKYEHSSSKLNDMENIGNDKFKEDIHIEKPKNELLPPIGTKMRNLFNFKSELPLFSIDGRFRNPSDTAPNHPSYRVFPPNYPFPQLDPLTALPTRLTAPPPPGMRIRRNYHSNFMERSDSLLTTPQTIQLTGKQSSYSQFRIYNPEREIENIRRTQSNAVRSSTSSAEEDEEFDKSSQPLLDVFYTRSPHLRKQLVYTNQGIDDKQSVQNSRKEVDATQAQHSSRRLLDRSHDAAAEIENVNKNDYETLEEKNHEVEQKNFDTSNSGVLLKKSGEIEVESSPRPKIDILLEKYISKLPQPLHTRRPVSRDHRGLRGSFPRRRVKSSNLRMTHLRDNPDRKHHVTVLSLSSGDTSVRYRHREPKSRYPLERTIPLVPSGRGVVYVPVAVA